MIKIFASIAIISLLVFWDIVLFSKQPSNFKKKLGRLSFIAGIGCVLAILIIKVVEFLS